MNILFRADSSSKIGTGHIMRDLVLASKYKNKNNTIIFATLNLLGNINNKIQENKYQVEILRSNEIDELELLIKKLHIDLLVIDHYEIDYNYEKEIKKRTDVKILSFDDIYEKHYCDILLNHNIYADEKRYKDLVPKECEIQCGSKYTLLREEFIEGKKKKTILLMMGGADSANLNIKILQLLSNYSHIKVLVLTTHANQNLGDLKEYSKNKKWIKLEINSTKVAKLIKKSDFAITTPSVSVNELYFMDTPFIAIKIANNQKEMYNFLKKKKFSVLKEYNKKELEKQLKYFL